MGHLSLPLTGPLIALPTQDDANLDPFIETQHWHRTPGASAAHQKCWLLGKRDLVMRTRFTHLGEWSGGSLRPLHCFSTGNLGLPSAKGNVRAGISPQKPTWSQLECAWGRGHYSFPRCIEIELTCSSVYI